MEAVTWSLEEWIWFTAFSDVYDLLGLASQGSVLVNSGQFHAMLSIRPGERAAGLTVEVASPGEPERLPRQFRSNQ